MKNAWEAFSRGLYFVTTPIRLTVTFVLLLLVFGLILTPIGWVGRAFGRDPLRRKDPGASMWVDSVATDATPEGPFRPS